MKKVCHYERLFLACPAAIFKKKSLKPEIIFVLILKDVGARNHRRICAVNYNKTPGFEVRLR